MNWFHLADDFMFVIGAFIFPLIGGYAATKAEEETADANSKKKT